MCGSPSQGQGSLGVQEGDPGSFHFAPTSGRDFPQGSWEEAARHLPARYEGHRMTVRCREP